MRATSFCYIHPSHEAKLRCTSCGRWVCDRCARVHADRIYCSSHCRRVQLARRTASVALSLLRYKVDAVWSIAIVSCAAAMLLFAVGYQLTKLLEYGGPAPVPLVSGGATARLIPVEHAWRLEITGPRNQTVMVNADGLAPITLILDRRGRATIDGLELPPGVSSVQLTLLAYPPTMIEAELTPTPSATTTPSTTMTPSASLTPSPSPTATPAPDSAAARSATPSRKLTAQERRLARSAPPVLHLVTDVGPRIAITFDGADSANGTTELLDLLQEIDLETTLFVTGEFIDEHPRLIRHALLAGHEIGNHTYSHHHLTSWSENRRHQLLEHVTRDWLHDELRRTEEAFRRATGRRMAPLWRAPFGEENALLRGWAMELGYLHVRWSSLGGSSLDSLDWVDDEHSSLYRDSSRMVERLLSFPKLEGGIVLMHLASERPDPPWNALPGFVERLEERGLESVTVSEMLRQSKTWRHWLERAERRHREAFPISAR
jgi:peptidoglycan/xylan/chitin deacetylase (PgdA/CDA1 family)